MCEKYNGWTNRETWLVKLWIDNEPHTSEEALRLARVMARHDEGIGSSREALLADQLEDWTRLMVDEQTSDMNGEPLAPSMASDLLGTALARVDWYEIATAYLEDVAEQ